MPYAQRFMETLPHLESNISRTTDSELVFSYFNQPAAKSYNLTLRVSGVVLGEGWVCVR